MFYLCTVFVHAHMYDRYKDYMILGLMGEVSEDPAGSQTERGCVCLLQV